MGKLTDDILKWTLDIDGNPARKELTEVSNSTNKLERDNRALATEMAKLEAHGKKGGEEWKKYEAQIKANDTAISANKKRMEELRKEVGLNNLSATELRKEMGNLKRQMDRMDPNSKQWAAANTQFTAMRSRLTQIQGGINGVNGVFGQLKSLLPALGIGAVSAGLISLWNKIRPVREEFEKYEAVLTNSLGSQRTARKELNMLSDFAAQTPYQLSELTGAYVKLVNYGLKPTKKDLIEMGDLASSVGKGFDQLTEAMADAVTGEFERLKEFGIKAKKEGDKITFTFKEQSTVVDANAASIKNYLTGLGRLQGVAGSMAAISQTMGGASSNMSDSFDRLFNKWGSGALGSYFVTQMRNITGFIDKLAGKTPTLVEELTSVRAELDKELLILENGNFTADQRAAIIRKINTEYKDYLPNLLDEKSSLDDIQKFHAKINNQLQARIIYAGYEEEIKNLLKQQSQALAGNFEIEKRRTELALGLNKSMQDRNPDEFNNLLNKANSINNSIIENTDQKTKEVKDKYEFMAKAIGTTFAEIQKMIESSTNVNGNKNKDLTDDAKKKAAESAIKQLDSVNNKRMSVIAARFEREAWTEDKFRSEQLSAELAYLTLKKALLEKFGQDVTNVDAAINQKRAEMQKSINDALASADKELFDEIAKDSKIIDKSVDESIKIANTAVDQIDRQKDREKEILEERQQNYLNFAVSIGESFGRLMSDSEATFGDYLANTLEMALEAFHQFFLIEKYKTIIANAGKGPLGWIKGAAQVAAMELAYQAAKSLITKTFSSKGKQSGGFSNTDGPDNQPDGVYHKNEWIASAQIVRNPTARPILNIFEWAQRNGKAATLNFPAVLASVGMASKQSGGFAGTSNQSFNPSVPQFAAGLDKETANRLAQAIEDLTEWQPVLAVETYEKKAEHYREITGGGLK